MRKTKEIKHRVHSHEHGAHQTSRSMKPSPQRQLSYRSESRNFCQSCNCYCCPIVRAKYFENQQMYEHRYYESQYTHYAWTPDYQPYANYYPAGYYYHPYSPVLPQHYSTGYVTPNKQ